MSLICNEGITVPNLTESPCPDGVFYSTSCVVHESAIVSLDLPENSLLSAVINALVSVNIANRALIDSLTARVEASEG